MKPRTRVALSASLLAAAAAAGCGQEGPLMLPEEARPIERIETPASEQNDDEEQDER